MLAHRLLGGSSSSLSVACPSLGSALIAAARARLWSLFRWCSESPLLAHPETMVSCCFGSCRLFPGLPPSQLWRANPFRLCSCRQPQCSPCDPTSEARASAPSPARPGGGADKPLGLVSAGWRRSSVRESLCCALRTPVAALSSVAPKLPPPPPAVPAREGAPSVWKSFLLHSSLLEVQVPSLFFCLCYFFFLLPYPGIWEVSCLLGSLRSSASVQWVFCRSSSTCRCILDVFVGKKMISMSYSSAILKVPSVLWF